jgi:hypothetical protein
MFLSVRTLFILFGLIVFISGCTGVDGFESGIFFQADAATMRPEEALDALFQGYVNSNRPQFAEYISKKYHPSQSALIASINAHPAPAAFHYTVHSTCSEGSRHEILFDWEKKKAGPTGAFTYRTGRAAFVMRKEGAYWRLLRIKGESPFAE